MSEIGIIGPAVMRWIEQDFTQRVFSSFHVNLQRPWGSLHVRVAPAKNQARNSM